MIFLIGTESFLIIALLVLTTFFLRNDHSKKKHNVKEDIQKIKKQLKQ